MVWIELVLGSDGVSVALNVGVVYEWLYATGYGDCVRFGTTFGIA